MKDPIWGIDLGGTKIEGVILPSLNEATPILRMRIDSESGKGYTHILERIRLLVAQMQEQSGLQPTKIGFGTPGVLDPILKTMKNCNSTALNGQPLQSDLENILGVPVVLANDANCFALAETHWGVVKQKFDDAAVVFGIILGTGVGGGIVMNGKLWNGRHGIAGEWGHNFLDQSGGPCYCGKTGCVETILSGPALERFYHSISGKKATLKEITHNYTSQPTDHAAKQTIERLTLFFGKAVSVVTNLLDPDIIVVGGGVGNIDVLYSAGIDSLRNHIFNNRLDVTVCKPALGDSAGVFGAAALVS